MDFLAEYNQLPNKKPVVVVPTTYNGDMRFGDEFA